MAQPSVSWTNQSSTSMTNSRNEIFYNRKKIMIPMLPPIPGSLKKTSNILVYSSKGGAISSIWHIPAWMNFSFEFISSSRRGFLPGLTLSKDYCAHELLNMNVFQTVCILGYTNTKTVSLSVVVWKKSAYNGMSTAFNVPLLQVSPSTQRRYSPSRLAINTPWDSVPIYYWPN